MQEQCITNARGLLFMIEVDEADTICIFRVSFLFKFVPTFVARKGGFPLFEENNSSELASTF